MALKKCKGCGRFFGSKDIDYCSNCKHSHITGLDNSLNPEEQKFLYARNIVYDFPDISPINLVKKMQDEGIDIEVKDVMRYVKQGRLILKSVSDGNYCEDCSVKILSGRKCPMCTKKMEDAISRGDVSSKEDMSSNEKDGPRMYIKKDL